VPVFRLSDALVFPDPSLADDGGLLAVGGDLRPERLLLAYSNGIFPWYSEGRPILWWCPAPRYVLLPDELHVGRSLRKAMKRAPFRIAMDAAFERVMDRCAKVPRPGQGGTWITKDMRAAYLELHRRGIAHSVEAYEDDRLVGGLYGLAIGSVFFGESMFADAPDASKIAFATLVEQLRRWGFTLIDCQVHTEHLERFGAHMIELDDFLARLKSGIAQPGHPPPWRFEAPPPPPPPR
jgi:leucyl/phenylalanyl-tRNA--protein transferase